MKKLKFVTSSKKDIYTGIGYEIYKLIGVNDSSISAAKREEMAAKGIKPITFSDVLITVSEKTPEWLKTEFIKLFNSVGVNSSIWLDAHPLITTSEYNDKLYTKVEYKIYDVNQIAIDNTGAVGNDFEVLEDDDLPF